MPSTSPYQSNDYAAISQYRPYKLPIQDIAQTAVALDAWWKEGAARVKSTYNSALNLSLTSGENREMQKKFMEDSQKQLTKLASMDLSDPSVQRQGFGIFKPIFQDDSIMKDDYLTNLKKTIFTDADKYKNDVKTKGSGFHIDNLAYALKGFQGFNEKTSRNQISGIYENAKDSQYIPFYDDSKERFDILKACTANKISNTYGDNGAYLHTSSDNSKTESKIWGCLDSGLSQQSRQQARISGSVRYGHDYQSLKNDYVDAATGQLKQYTNEKAILVAKQEALKIAPDSQDKKDKLEDMQKRIDQYEEGITSVKERLNGSTANGVLGYNQWDEEYMKEHYEDLAATAYFRKSNLAFASSFATTDITKADKANPIWITERTQAGQDARIKYSTEQGFLNDVALENLKQQNKLLSGDGTGGGKDILLALKNCANTEGCDPSKYGNVVLRAQKEEPTTSHKLQAEITNLEGTKLKTVRDLANDDVIGPLISHLNLKNVSDYGTQEYNDNYNKMWEVLNNYADNAIKNDKNDVTALKIIKATNDLLMIDNKKDMLGGVYDDARTQVTKNNPEIAKIYNEKRSKILSSIKPVTTSNGEIFSSEKLGRILEGADSEYAIRDNTTTPVFTGPGMSSSGGTSYSVIDKKTGVVKISFFDTNTVESYRSLHNSTAGSYNKEINKLIGQDELVQKMGLALGNVFTKDSMALKNMEALVGQRLGIVTTGTPGKKEVVFSSGDIDPVTGEVTITAYDDDGEVSAQRIRDAINKSGAGNSIFAGEGQGKVAGDDNALRIKLPMAANIVPSLVYGDNIRKQLGYYERQLVNFPNDVKVIKVGKAKDGTSFSVKLRRGIGNNEPSYTLIGTGLDEYGNPSKKEVPFRNAGKANDKENIISTLNSRLLGLLEQ